MTPRTAAFQRLKSSKPLQSNFLRSISPLTTIHLPKPSQHHLCGLRKLPNVHFQHAFLFLPPVVVGAPRYFLTSPSRCDKTNSSSKDEEEILKETEGKQEAEANLGANKRTEDLARIQSVPWHKVSDGKPPPYQHREVSDSDQSVAIPNRKGTVLFFVPISPSHKKL
jgi:hypothetical protein